MIGADQLQSRFALTPTEARLALHLATGDSMRSAAVLLNMTYETARTHLKNIFAKTGTNRQSQLAILILNLHHAPLSD
jgi:DNA-binding CsgD family transcriptional regulator